MAKIMKSVATESSETVDLDSDSTEDKTPREALAMTFDFSKKLDLAMGDYMV